MVAVRQMRERVTQIIPMILRESASAEVSWGGREGEMEGGRVAGRAAGRPGGREGGKEGGRERVCPLIIYCGLP